MDNALQNWISTGALAPSPVVYDNYFIRNMARRHNVKLLFYMGDLNDSLLNTVRGVVENLVVLNKKLDVSAKYIDSEEFTKLDFNFIYNSVQGDRLINFIDYCPAFKSSFIYIIDTLWKTCFDGSVYIVKGAYEFLKDTGLSLQEIQDVLNSCANREHYKVRIEIDMIIIEKG